MALSILLLGEALTRQRVLGALFSLGSLLADEAAAEVFGGGSFATLSYNFV